MELLGLSQFLPGPTSTQVSFALGVVQKGVPGGLISGEAPAGLGQGVRGYGLGFMG